MKRALIITYYWPPSGGAGVQRWLKFVKYLRDFQWEPVVFIPENPEYPEIDHSLGNDIPHQLETLSCRIWEPYDVYKKILGQKKDSRISAGFLTETKKNPILEGLSVWIRGNLFIPDARKFWIRPAVKTLSNYLSGHPVDAIVSTGPPHSTHLIAQTLKKQFNLPWLADFRDPWTNIDFYKDLKLTRWADKKHHSLERGVLQQADAVTVISNTMAEDCKKLVSRHYDVITNGFDPEDIASSTRIIPDEKFSVAHIGTLGPARNPVVLWQALKALLQEKPDFQKFLVIKLVGKVDLEVLRSISNHGLDQYLNKIPYLPHSEVIKCQKQSRVLLLVINNTPNAAMILTGKFFEYMAAGRPVLCIGPENGDAAMILKETGTGLLAGFNDVDTMRSHLEALFENYLQNIPFETGDAILPYSRKELTSKLATILNRISKTEN
jgi:glycosyltransferase involved in cell wall biosynthesis